MEKVAKKWLHIQAQYSNHHQSVWIFVHNLSYWFQNQLRQRNEV